MKTHVTFLLCALVLLPRHDLIEPLFASFHTALEAQGMFARKGQMVDATFVEVARQRNSREDNATIKAGGVPAEWKENPSKARQKDVDARWTKKNDQRYYGYKNQVKVDSRRKLIDDFTGTSASVHDRQALEELIAEGDPETYVDSAYTGAPCAQVFAAKKVEAKPIERAWRNKPLNGRQRRSNHARSRIRVRVEHVFAAMRMILKSAWNRCIGMTCNRTAIGLTNLVYNLVRYAQIERLGLRNWRTALPRSPKAGKTKYRDHSRRFLSRLAVRHEQRSQNPGSLERVMHFSLKKSCTL